jgi:hypothetical protein
VSVVLNRKQHKEECRKKLKGVGDFFNIYDGDQVHPNKIQALIYL